MKSIRMPHAGGDEPYVYMAAVHKRCVCPTQVGMNRSLTAMCCTLICMPHAGGDEPTIAEEALEEAQYAPRRWG